MNKTQQAPIKKLLDAATFSWICIKCACVHVHLYSPPEPVTELVITFAD